MIFGKWMRDNQEENADHKLQNISQKVRKAIESEITSILKVKAVEEMKTLEVDKKQQEDSVLNNYFEKVETIEEFGGSTWRDFDGSDEMDEHANALEELNLSNTVRVDDTAHSVYQAEFVENVNVADSADIEKSDYHVFYDEWNYAKKKYRKDYCKVYPKNIHKKSVDYYKKTILNNASTLTGLRKMLTSVNNKAMQIRRQTQGENFDTDALTDFFIDIQTGHTPSEKIYISSRRKEKDLSILMLLDTSLSSDSYANNKHVIDVEKEVSILFGEILNEFNVDFSIDSFNSKTRNFTNYYSIKAFDEDWNKAKYKVGSIEPAGYTRIGTALRHSGALLSQRESKNKWVILISDGKPNDYDKYEGKYGINDVKQALRELNEQHINSYALAIEAQAKYYLPLMFGANHFEILTSPVQLLESLAKLYEKIKYKS
jgi:nitric oxide reductase NorD protein